MIIDKEIILHSSSPVSVLVRPVFLMYSMLSGYFLHSRVASMVFTQLLDFFTLSHLLEMLGHHACTG